MRLGKLGLTLRHTPLSLIQSNISQIAVFELVLLLLHYLLWRLQRAILCRLGRGEVNRFLRPCDCGSIPDDNLGRQGEYADFQKGTAGRIARRSSREQH